MFCHGSGFGATAPASRRQGVQGANLTTRVRAALEAAGIEVLDGNSPMIPSMQVPITDEADARKVLKLIDALEDNDDVQDVFANFDISDDLMEAAAAE